MIEAMREKGDADGADVWLRIIVAIGTLGEPPTEARHWRQGISDLQSARWPRAPKPAGSR